MLLIKNQWKSYARLSNDRLIVIYHHEHHKHYMFFGKFINVTFIIHIFIFIFIKNNEDKKKLFVKK